MRLEVMRSGETLGKTAALAVLPRCLLRLGHSHLRLLARNLLSTGRCVRWCNSVFLSIRRLTFIDRCDCFGRFVAMFTLWFPSNGSVGGKGCGRKPLHQLESRQSIEKSLGQKYFYERQNQYYSCAVRCAESIIFFLVTLIWVTWF